MNQLDLFDNEIDKNLEEMEQFISAMENQLQKLEEQKNFFQENKAFDWAKEFPQLSDSDGNWTGFDVVIGNPPYIYSRNNKFTENEKKYYSQNFQLHSNQINTFSLFIEKSFSLINKTGGVCLIVPNNLLTINSFWSLRKHIIEYYGNILVINILQKVFEKANVDTCIIGFGKQNNNTLTIGELDNESLQFSKTIHKEEVTVPDYIFRISLQKNTEIAKLIAKIEQNTVELRDVAVVSSGLKVYQTGKGKPAQTDEIKQNRKFHSTELIDKNYGKYLAGADVCRYLLKWSGEYLNYGDWIAEPRKSVPFAGKRILVRQIPAKMPYAIHSVYTEDAYYNDINSMVIFNSQLDLKYILAILNSRLISFWFTHKFDKMQRNIFPQFKVNELAAFPVVAIDSAELKYRKIIELVDKMLNCAKQKHNAEINQLNAQIDAMIYNIFEITKEEIKTIENY